MKFWLFEHSRVQASHRWILRMLYWVLRDGCADVTHSRMPHLNELHGCQNKMYSYHSSGACEFVIKTVIRILNPDKNSPKQMRSDFICGRFDEVLKHSHDRYRSSRRRLKFSSGDWAVNVTSILAAINWKSTFFHGVFLLSRDLRCKVSWISEKVFSS